MTPVYCIDFNLLTVRAFKTFSDANYFAIGGEDVVATDIHIGESYASTDEIAKMAAKLGKPQKFDSRAAACRGLFAILQAAAIPVDPRDAPPQRAARVPSDDPVARPEPKPHEPRAPKEPKEPKAVVVRPTPTGPGPQLLLSSFIYPAGVSLQRNPRRDGTKGHLAMSIIIGKPGVTIAEYYSAGGRPQDLRWDIEHGNAEVTPTKRQE